MTHEDQNKIREFENKEWLDSIDYIIEKNGGGDQFQILSLYQE